MTTMINAQKAKRPASYLPSIENTDGQPVSHWFAIQAAAGSIKHMELVNLLKEHNKFGYGHANALIVYHLAKH